MKLWILRPRGYKDGGDVNSPWKEYDCVLGFVVRAETQARARELAQREAGGEKDVWLGWEAPEHWGTSPVWQDAALSTCVELIPDGTEAVVMRDYHAG